MAARLIGAWNPALDSAGNPISGSKLYTYAAGTTTNKTTYTDVGLVTPNTNPVLADSAGRFPELWSADGGVYDLKWTDASGAQLELFQSIQALGAGATGAVTRDFGADGKFNLESRGGITYLESGDADPDSIGGQLRLGGWNGSRADHIVLDGTTVEVTGTFSGTVQRGAIGGLILSTAGSSATFGVAVGQASDSTATATMVLPSAFTKTTGAWTVGTGNGALDTGTIANSTWYHVYLIKRPDSGLVDLLVSLSPTSPTLPTNYTLFRRIGSMKTDGSAHWTAFVQLDDFFLWKTPVVDVNAVIPTSGAQNTVTLSVPPGIQCQAKIAAQTQWNAGAVVVLFIYSKLLSAPPSVSPILSQATYAGGVLDVIVDTSAQIYAKLTYATSTYYSIETQGWADARGRNG